MNGYATLTADEHEYQAGLLAHMADNFRSDPLWTDMQYGSRKMRIRQYQNMAVMHMEDAQRMRSYGRK